MSFSAAVLVAIGLFSRAYSVNKVPAIYDGATF